jgi:hypothetical protein
LFGPGVTVVDAANRRTAKNKSISYTPSVKHQSYMHLLAKADLYLFFDFYCYLFYQIIEF